jgi:hypothetical protein
MYHSEFNLFWEGDRQACTTLSLTYFLTCTKSRFLFTAHRVVLVSKCRSRHDLVHQILEPYAVVTATAQHNEVFLKKIITGMESCS